MLERALVLVTALVLAACAGPDARRVQPSATATDMALTGLAQRAGLVRVLVYEPGDPRRGPRRHVVNGGSGTLVGATGLVATAAHVAVDPLYRVQVRTLDGALHEAWTVHFDRRHDLALLCVPGLTYRVGALPRATPPAADEPVLGFGFPGSGRPAAVAGHVRGDRPGEAIQYGGFALEGPLEVELDIAPGYSGGPVLDADGALLGLLVGFAMEFDHGRARGLGVAYAVPGRMLVGGGFAAAARACNESAAT